MSDTPEPTDWRPIDLAPVDVLHLAIHMSPPALGRHVGKVETLPDGRWLVLKFSETGGKLESYFILPKPPK